MDNFGVFEISSPNTICKNCKNKQLELSECSFPDYDGNTNRVYSLNCVNQWGCEYMYNTVTKLYVDKPSANLSCPTVKE